MDLPAEAPALPQQYGAGTARLECDAPVLPAVPLLPVVTRCVSLLTLLLQDAAVDLELASSVVALDPGLTFGTLYLANRERKAGDDAIWQLPQAMVAAGCEWLAQLLQACPRVESSSNAATRKRLAKLVEDAVVRACVTHFLARELGSASPRKSYLCGLLFEVPVLAKLSSPPVSQTELLPAMCRTLPAGVVRAAMAKAFEDAQLGTSDPLVATVLAAEAIVRARAVMAEWPETIQELADAPLWLCWEQTDALERTALLARCGDVAEWASASLRSIEPWQFMARLERRQPWE